MKTLFVTHVGGKPVVAARWNQQDVYLADVLKPIWHENYDKGWEEAERNAHEFVRACNSHDRLVEACETLLRWDTGDHTVVELDELNHAVRQARAALADARKGE